MFARCLRSKQIREAIDTAEKTDSSQQSRLEIERRRPKFPPVSPWSVRHSEKPHLDKGSTDTSSQVYGSIRNESSRAQRRSLLHPGLLTATHRGGVRPASAWCSCRSTGPPHEPSDEEALPRRFRRSAYGAPTPAEKRAVRKPVTVGRERILLADD